MKFLLDENFPLPLYHRLRDKGFDAGQRLFDLAPDGELYPWEIKDGVRSSVRSED